MKKYSMNMAAILLPLLIASFVISCKKEESISGIDRSGAKPELQSTISSKQEKKEKEKVQRPYKDHFDTYYRFEPDFAGGWLPPANGESPSPAPAWYPGGGEGNATHMGKVWTLYNQHADFNSMGGLTSSAASVNMFFAAALQQAGIVAPANVSTVVFDKKGNSVWFILQSNVTTPISTTRINFSGTSKIVGGSGKFVGATGEVSLQGYFNPTDFNDAGVDTNGFIVY